MCNDCPICIEPLFPTNNKNIMRLKKKILVRRGERLPITKLKCGHTFHNSCIKKWFMKTDVDASDRCPMCRDKIVFKKHSKDFMMNKLRWDDPCYEYGDEDLYDVDTEDSGSEYSGDSGSDGSESSLTWQEAWDDMVETLRVDTGEQDLSIPLGDNWEDIITSYLHGGMESDEVWRMIDERSDDEAWDNGQTAWDQAIQGLNRRERELSEHREIMDRYYESGYQ